MLIPLEFFLMLFALFLFVYLFDLLIFFLCLWHPCFFNDFPQRWYLRLIYCWQFLFLPHFFNIPFELNLFKHAFIYIFLCTLVIENLLGLSFWKRLLKSLLLKNGLFLLLWKICVNLGLWTIFMLIDDYWFRVIHLLLIRERYAFFSAFIELFIILDVFFLHFRLIIAVFAQSESLFARNSSLGLFLNTASTKVAFNESIQVFIMKVRIAHKTEL